MTNGGHRSAGTEVTHDQTLKRGIANDIPHHAEAADDKDAVERALGDIRKARGLRDPRTSDRIGTKRLDDVGLVLSEAHRVERRLATSGGSEHDLEASFLEYSIRSREFLAPISRRAT